MVELYYKSHNFRMRKIILSFLAENNFYGPAGKFLGSWSPWKVFPHHFSSRSKSFWFSGRQPLWALCIKKSVTKHVSLVRRAEKSAMFIKSLWWEWKSGPVWFDIMANKKEGYSATHSTELAPRKSFLFHSSKTQFEITGIKLAW